MKALFALVLLTASTSFAFDIVTVTTTEKSEKYDGTTVLDLLKTTASPMASEINTQVKALAGEYTCDAVDAVEWSQGSSQDSYTTFKLVAANENYISYLVNYDNYCGGAYPNYDYNYFTFNTQTGEKVELAAEFGLIAYGEPNYDEAKAKAIQTKIAAIMLKYGAKEDVENCFDAAVSQQERLDQIVSYFPGPDGLSDKKEIVFSFTPPHAAMACKFSVPVGYEVVKDMINQGSFLEAWLK